jgi:hypothetical protein
MKPIHKRRHERNGVAFTTLGEAADFIEELEGLLMEAGTKTASSINVSTEDRDYPGLTVEELAELSPALPLESVSYLYMDSGIGFDQPVHAELTIQSLNEHDMVEFKANGQNQVAVDGVNVWATKEIDDRVEQIEKARELAEVKSAPHTEGVPPQPPSSWHQFFEHPLVVQILAGTIAAILAGVILYLLLS